MTHFFPYIDHLISAIPQMELAANSTTPRITQEELNYVDPNLTNSPETRNAILTGSNKSTSIERLSPCNCRLTI